MNYYNWRFASDSQTLEKHDEQHHDGHFDPETMSCKLREDLEADNLSGESGTNSSDSVTKAAEDEALRILSELGGSVLGNSMVKDFKDAGGTSLVGREVRSSGDLADLATVFRNPNFETFRWFVVKDGKIAYQTGVTSRLPGHTVAARPWRTMNVLSKAHDTLGKCDGVYALHNHPSERVKPSNNDLTLTRQIASRLERMTGLKFLGHVVIDHDKYSTISPDGEVSLDIPLANPVKPWKEHGRTTPYVANEDGMEPFDGRVVDKSSSIARLGKDLEIVTKSGKDDAQIVMLTRDYKVTGIATVSLRRLMSIGDEEIGDFLRRYAAASGGAQCAITYDMKKNGEYGDRMESLVRKTILVDAVDRNPENGRTENFGIRGRRNLEPDKDRYEIGRFRGDMKSFEVRADDPTSRLIDGKLDREVERIVNNPESYGYTPEQVELLRR